MDDRIPDNYFQQFPDDLIRRLELMEDDISSVAPRLVGLGKESAYRVPDDYFEQAEDAILYSTINSVGKKAPQLYRLLSYCAAAVLLLMILFLGRGSEHSGKGKEILEPNQLLAVEDYLFDEAILVELENWLNDDIDITIDDFSDDEIETVHELIINEMVLEDFTDEELSELL